MGGRQRDDGDSDDDEKDDPDHDDSEKTKKQLLIGGCYCIINITCANGATMSFNFPTCTTMYETKVIVKYACVVKDIGYGNEYSYQISQSKSKVVVFGGEQRVDVNHDATRWLIHGMYNDDKKGIPDHIEEVEKQRT